jgi:cell division protein FtsQ
MRRLSPTPARNGTGRSATGRRKPARPPARRRPRAKWQVALLRWGGPALGLAAVIGAGSWAWSSGWADRQWAALSEATLEASGEAGLALREVLVQGRSRTSQQDLMTALDLELGTPILSLDPAVLRARLEALPWVARATVERRLPDTLFISVEEREPLALWQREGEIALIDRTGAVIREPVLQSFVHLPMVVGDGANGHAAELVEMLALTPDLARRVKAAIWVGDRRWNIRLDNGVDVRLPEEDGAAAWSELASLQAQHGLIDRDLAAIDLRQPDRLIVRLTPEAAARRRDPGDST